MLLRMMLQLLLLLLMMPFFECATLFLTYRKTIGQLGGGSVGVTGGFDFDIGISFRCHVTRTYTLVILS